MKVFLMLLAIIVSTGVMAGEALKVWNYSSLKEVGLSAKDLKASMRISPDIKTPERESVLEVALDEFKQKTVPWAIQLKYKYNKSLKTGHSYELSFLCKASVPGSIQMVAAMNKAPWKTIGSTKQFDVSKKWQKIKLRFLVRKDCPAPLALPRMMLADYGQKALLYFGPVTLQDLSEQKGAKIAKNLIFNSSFELDISGYNCARYLYPPTNPKMKYVKAEIDSTTFVSGKQSLKIPNPFADEVRLYPREVHLEPGMKYTLSFWGKSDKPKTIVTTFFLASSARVHSKWTGHGHRFILGTKWKRFSFTFTKKTDVTLNPYLFYLRFGHGKNAVPCTLWLDDIQLDQGKQKTYKAGSEIEFASIPSENFIISKNGHAKIPSKFRISNNLTKKCNIKILVSVIDDYYQKTAFSKKINISLKAGETKEIKFDILVSTFGSYTIDAKLASPAGIKFQSQPGAFGVIGKYVSKAIDLDKTFCISFNGPSSYMFTKHVVSKPGCFRGLGCGPDEFARRLSIMGCRLLRDWTANPKSFSWKLVEKEEGKFNFFYADMITNLFSRHGIAILPVLHAVFNHVEKPASWRYPEPEWMIQMRKNSPKAASNTGGKKDYRKLPIEKWNAYVKAVVKHFKGRISHYEIMNEPNLFTPGAKFYMPYLESAFNEIRKTDPTAKVIGFSTTGDKGKDVEAFMKKCFTLGGLKYADIVSWHPYFARELSSKLPADKQIQDIFNLTRKYGKAKIPLWNTEVFYLYGTEWGSIPPYKPHHAAKRLLTDLGEGVAQSITVEEAKVWKDLISPNFKYHNISLPAFEYLPTDNYVFYNAFARFFEGAKPIGKFRWANRAICYVFERDGHFIAAFWNYARLAGIKAKLPNKAGDIQLFDMFGNKLPFDGRTLKIGIAPRYLKWKNGSANSVRKALSNVIIIGEKPFKIERALLLKDSGKLLLSIRNMSGKIITNANVSANDVKTKISKFAPMELKELNLDVKAGMGDKASVKINISGANKPFSSVETANIVKSLRLIEDKSSAELPIAKPVIGKPVSAKDFSAAFTIKYERSDLVLNVKVKDDKRSQPARRLFNEDALQIYIDAFPMRTSASFPDYAKTTYKIIIGAWRKGKTRINGGGFPGKIQSKVKPASDGYEISIRIPLGGIPDFKMFKKKMIGFDISVEDSDATSRKTELVWNGTADNYCNRSRFAIMEFN